MCDMRTFLTRNLGLLLILALSPSCGSAHHDHGEMLEVVGPEPEECSPEAFGWPPAAASGRWRLDQRYFAAAAKLGEVDEILATALTKVGHDRTYFVVPGGFAMVTRLEQIEPDGTPKGETDRWNAEVSPLREFSVEAYLRALFSARRGYFRVLVFIVTDRSLTSSGRRAINSDTIKAWRQRGCDSIPRETAQVPYEASRHRVIALIYEFEKLETQQVFVEQGRLRVQTHLEKLGLIQALEE